MIMIDTNLLCRLAHRGHEDSQVARGALQRLRQGGEQLAIIPQNMYEFWSVATRARGMPPVGSNGLGMSIEMACKWMEYFEKRMIVLPDNDRILPLWRDLVRSHRISGHKCHDVRIVAAMQSHGVGSILTFNAGDFRRFAFLSVIDPRAI
jgi:predicted nucleic acid-binding protein